MVGPLWLLPRVTSVHPTRDPPVTEKAKLEPQKAEEGEFMDLEGLDLTSKLDLLRKNEQWKCQVKKEALEVRFGCSWICLSSSLGRTAREREMDE